ncbi:MAG: phytoene/squalene synthase family protein [Pseudomonadota bacterium]
MSAKGAPTADAAYARAAIANGSRSFAAASRLLPGAVRDDVARLYAWCRHCDDVIDGQVLGHGERQVEDGAGKLAELRSLTEAALTGTPTGQPVFDGFGDVCATHGITPRLAGDLLDGFALDVEGARYDTFDDLCRYCYGVAGAVGVMMGLVIGVPRDETCTLDRACDLGLAFQMTNIARDVVADAKAGRVYLPAQWLEEVEVEATPSALLSAENQDAVWRVSARLVETAEAYYLSANVGVARLPFRTAWAIASAGKIYRAIGSRRRAAGPERLGERVATNSGQKIVILATSALSAARRDGRGAAPSRTGLWQRPPRP